MRDAAAARRQAAPALGATGAEARLGPLIGALLGVDRRIAALEAAPSPFAGVWPAATASVTLDGGTTMALWIKWLPGHDQGHPDKPEPDREPRVYAELLGDPDLPVARCHGCAPDPETGERVLVLEHVPDWDLRYHGLETWEAAVTALARLHLRFAARGDELRRLGYLLRVDADYVSRWRARAAEALERQAPAMARRLDGLRTPLEEVATLVGAQAPTLIHNDLAPKNIVADTAHDPPRICLVDWETAGVGCASLDLAHLLHGLEPPAGERLVARYADAAPGLLAAGDEGARVMAACRAHKTVYRIAHRALWSPRPALVQTWLDELEQDVRLL